MGEKLGGVFFSALLSQHISLFITAKAIILFNPFDGDVEPVERYLYVAGLVDGL